MLGPPRETEGGAPSSVRFLIVQLADWDCAPPEWIEQEPPSDLVSQAASSKMVLEFDHELTIHIRFIAVRRLDG
jgi:hypothetical protein